MSERALAARPKASSAPGAGHTSLLQRPYASGTHLLAGGQDVACAQRNSGLQRKLRIGDSNDPLEREADRVADQVLAAPAHGALSSALPRIQRYPGPAGGQADTVPASVERVLGGSGQPLDPALQQDMAHRFGRDFSRVRVHSGGAAEQSARDVNAQAYTVGHDIVFGAGRFTPGTQAGQRLLAHELTHVVQQTGAAGIGTTGAYLARTPLPGAATEGAVSQEGTPGRARAFTPQLSSDPGTAVVEVMGIIESIRPSASASGLYTLARGGEVLTLTQLEYDRIRASARRILLDSLGGVRRRAANAQDQYDAQHAIDEHHWIVSRVVRYVGGIRDPGGTVRQNVLLATVNANAAQAFIEGGQLVRGAECFARSERYAIIAKTTSQAYVDNLISTAEGTVIALEVTAGVAAVTVVAIGAVLAAPVVIPAIAGAARAAPLIAALGTGAVPAAPVVAAEAAVVAAPAVAAVAAPAVAAVAAPTVAAVAAPTVAAVATPAVAAVAAPTVVSSSALLTTAAAVAVTATTLSSDSPAPPVTDPRSPRRRYADAYPILWPAVLGPPMLFGVPVTLFIKGPRQERDEHYAWEVRRELWARHRGTNPDLLPRDWHAHHIIPLFLGGLEATRGNVTFLPGRLHLRGHGQLNSQPQMLTPPPPLRPLSPNILSPDHVAGTKYELVGFK